FAQSDILVEDNFTFPMVYHYAMEPHSVIAHWGEDAITVWSSAQHPFQVRGDIAKVFRVPASRVRIVISYLGGGYGSKSYTKFEPLVVALARKAGAPVRICNSVADSMLTVRRHAAKVRIKTGFKNNGTIMAREAEISRYGCLRRQWPAGDDARSDASFGALSNSSHQNQRLFVLYQFRLRRLFPRHRRAASDFRRRVADGHRRGAIGD